MFHPDNNSTHAAAAAAASSDGVADTTAVTSVVLRTPVLSLDKNTFWRTRFRHGLNHALSRLPKEWTESRTALKLVSPLKETGQLSLFVNADFQLQADQTRGLDELPLFCPEVALTADKTVGTRRGAAEGWGVFFGVPIGAGVAVTAPIVATEIIVAGALSLATGGMALAVLLPLAAVGVIAGTVGYKYAKRYEAALKCTYPLLKEGRYADAKCALEGELHQRGRLLRLLRRPFLKHLHFAVGHYFDGMIAENDTGRKNHNDDALAAYDLACAEATAAKAGEVLLILRVRRLHLLKKKLCNSGNAPTQEAASAAQTQAQLKEELVLLEDYSGNHLRDLCCYITDNMLQYVQAFASHKTLSDEALKQLNALLRLESLFVFEQLKGAYGAFLTLAATFFRAATLSYFSHIDERKGCVTLETYHALGSATLDAHDTQSDRLRLAAQQFLKLLQAIPVFKQAHAASCDQSMQHTLRFMEEVAVQFVASHQAMGGHDVLVTQRLDEAQRHIMQKSRLRKQHQQYLLKGQENLEALQIFGSHYGLYFDAYESCLDAILNVGDNRIDDILSQVSTLDVFISFLTQFPDDLFPYQGHDKNHVIQCLKGRMLLKQLHDECGVLLSSLPLWVTALNDAHSHVIQDVIARSRGDALLARLPDLNTFKLFKSEGELKQIESNLQANIWLFNFKSRFKLSYESVEACLAALLNEADQPTACLLTSEKREKAFDLLADLAQKNLISAEENKLILVSVKKRAACIEINSTLNGRFPNFNAFVEAVTTPDHAEIIRILKPAEHEKILMDSLVKLSVLNQEGFFSEATVRHLVTTSSAWGALFFSLESQRDVMFDRVNTFLRAVFSQSADIDIILKCTHGELIDKLKSMPDFSEVLKERRLQAIDRLEARLYLLVNLNTQFQLDLPSIDAWITAMIHPESQVIGRVMRENGEALRLTLSACPASLLARYPFKDATNKLLERCFVVNINDGCGLSFSSFEEAMQSLQGEIAVATLRNPEQLLDLLAAFPEDHSQKPVCRSAILNIKARLHILKFNRLLMPALYESLEACFSVFYNPFSATAYEKHAELATWLDTLTEINIPTETKVSLQKHLKQRCFLFEVNQVLQEANSSTCVLPQFNTLSDCLLDKKNKLPTGVMGVVQQHLGHVLHEKMADLDQLNLSAAHVIDTRHQLINAILLQELKSRFFEDTETIFNCFDTLLHHPLVLDPLFNTGVNDDFIAWLKAFPKGHVTEVWLKNIIVTCEDRFFVLKFNQQFDCHFNTLNACLDALSDESNEAINTLLRQQGEILLEALAELPESSLGLIGEKKNAMHSLKKRLLLQSLRTEFDVEERTLDRALIVLARRLSVSQGGDVRTISREGRTLLHWLASFEEGCALRENVHGLAGCLLALRYHRDNQHITPEVMLRRRDPFELSNTFPSIQSETNAVQLRQLDEFLERVKQDAALRLAAADQREQFILLEGDSGTGKTTTVTDYLKRRGDCIVEVWEPGSAEEQYVGQAERKARKFFDRALKKADEPENRNKLYLLFVDEISSVCPALRGEASAGHHNPAAVVDVFQIGVTRIKGSRVVLIGATNYPNKISRAMLDRAQGGRISFRSPDLAGRERVLMFLFRQHILPSASIKHLAEITTGWSPRELGGIVKGMPCDGTLLDEGKLSAAFHEASRANEKAFSLVHSMVDLSLPVFKTKIEGDPLGELARIHPHLARRFDDIRSYLRQPGSYLNTRFHLLLFGPAGSGKTYAIKQLLRCTNLPYFVVRGAISAEELEQVFAYAAQFKPALFFVDEIDAICCIPGVQECLQTNMDGMVQSQVVVLGATNKKTELPAPIRSRFMEEEVPPLSPLQKQILLSKVVTEYLQPPFCLNAAPCLAQALAEGGAALAAAAGNLSVREVVRGLTCGLGRYDAEAKEAAQSQGGVPKVTLTLQQVLDCMTPEAQASVLQTPAPILIPQRNAAQLMQAVGFHRQGRPAEVSAAQTSASSAAPAASSR